MEPLTTLEGVAAALPRANIDTDMILSAQFMKTISRRGLGRYLFHALRTDDSGDPDNTFILNRLPWTNARFLVALDNFGCGSSREHAPWALLDFGIRCIIAPSFADIFANNCLKNGILPLVLDQELCDRLIVDATHSATAHLQLDLPCQSITFANGQKIHFDIEPEPKRQLVFGLDDIHETLLHSEAIAAHEERADYASPDVPINVGTRELKESPSTPSD